MNTRTRPWKLDYFNLLAVPSVSIHHVSCALPSNSKSISLLCGALRAELEPPKKTKKRKGQQPAGEKPEQKKKFLLFLVHPLCDSTTIFSKFIHKKKPHLRGKIKQCAAHLTGMLLHNEFAYCICIIFTWLSRDCVAEEDSLQILQKS
jgi:hypothetical protein